MSGFKDAKTCPQFVLFGDSLTSWSFVPATRGFGLYLQEWYQGKAEILNEGHAGYTSQHIKREYSAVIERITKANAPRTLLFTIFLGANDACFIGEREYVPLPQFEANIREFVETILIQDNLPDTKIVLITPPPINIPAPEPNPELDDEDLGPSTPAALKAARIDPKMGRGYQTYLSKKRYAEKIMQIAGEYEETGRVVGLDFWKALVDAALEEQGRSDDEDKYDLERLPGCGLGSAKPFREGYFTDGLHLDTLGYAVLSKVLVKIMLEKWPGLAPDSVTS